jgi:hypothetical protein
METTRDWRLEAAIVPQAERESCPICGEASELAVILGSVCWVCPRHGLVIKGPEEHAS